MGDSTGRPVPGARRGQLLVHERCKFFDAGENPYADTGYDVVDRFGADIVNSFSLLSLSLMLCIVMYLLFSNTSELSHPCG